MLARRSTILAALFVFAASGTLAHAEGAQLASPKQQTSTANAKPPPIRAGHGEAKNGRNQSQGSSTVVNGLATVPDDIMINLDIE